MRHFPSVVLICFSILSPHFPGTKSVDLKAIFHLVTTSVAQVFNSDCIFLASGRFQDESRAVHAQKYFAGGQRISSMSREESTLFTDKLRKVHTSCSRPTYVLFSVGDSLKESLLQSSKWSRHSGPVWLLFLNGLLESLEEVLADVNVPFDCQLLVVTPALPDLPKAADLDLQVQLTEVYRVAAHMPLQKNIFGNWSRENDLSASRESIYSRRNNLHGLVIKTTNAEDPPLSSVQYVNGSLHLSGFCGSVWTILEQRMNFTSAHSIVSPKAGNSWDAMIEVLLRKEAIVTSTYVTVTPSREENVDFSIPLATIPLRIFIREPSRDAHVDLDVVVAPFSKSLWFAFVVSASLSAFALASLAYCARHSGIDEDQFSVYDALFLVLAAVFCLQGHPQSARSLSCRVVCLVVYITGVIALASYSGIITSNLTVNKVEMPFTSLKELAGDEMYNFGLINNSLSHNQFKRSEDAVMQQLFVKHLASNESNLLGSYLEGFHRLCAHDFALLALSEALSAISGELNCTPVHLKHSYFKFTASLAFPKHSPYRDVFNYKVSPLKAYVVVCFFACSLLKLINGGILSDLHKAALNKKLPSLVKEVPSISLNAVAPILSLLAGGISLAIVFLMIEKFLLFIKSF